MESKYAWLSVPIFLTAMLFSQSYERRGWRGQTLHFFQDPQDDSRGKEVLVGDHLCMVQQGNKVSKAFLMVTVRRERVNDNADM
jgi:hypothetical protein